jgi:ribosomal-protein-alanine N-acetyltransferase
MTDPAAQFPLATGKVNRIDTPRFILRTLQVSDASTTYAGWFTDPVVRRFIAAATSSQDVSSLQSFIAEKFASPNAELFGIFVQGSGLHVGNIKFEPIDDACHRAILGILIGDPAWRGRGVFGEIYPAAAKWLFETRGIQEFWLGLDIDNSAALASYRRAGFSEAPAPTDLFGAVRHDAIYMKHGLR